MNIFFFIHNEIIVKRYHLKCILCNFLKVYLNVLRNSHESVSVKYTYKYFH